MKVENLNRAVDIAREKGGVESNLGKLRETPRGVMVDIDFGACNIFMGNLSDQVIDFVESLFEAELKRLDVEVEALE